MKIEFRVPRNHWATFKLHVSYTLFEADEPILTRHPLMQTDEFEYAAFESDHSSDIGYVLAMLRDYGGHCYVA